MRSARLGRLSACSAARLQHDRYSTTAVSHWVRGTRRRANRRRQRYRYQAYSRVPSSGGPSRPPREEVWPGRLRVGVVGSGAPARTGLGLSRLHHVWPARGRCFCLTCAAVTVRWGLCRAAVQPAQRVRPGNAGHVGSRRVDWCPDNEPSGGVVRSVATRSRPGRSRTSAR